MDLGKSCWDVMKHPLTTFPETKPVKTGFDEEGFLLENVALHMRCKRKGRLRTAISSHHSVQRMFI